MAAGAIELAGAFRFSESLVAILDASDGRIVDVNPVFEATTGVARAQAIGFSTVDLDIWPDIEVRAMIWARLRSVQRVSGEMVRFRGSGGRILVGRLFSEIFMQDDRRLALAVIQDIAESADASEAARDRLAVESYRSLFQTAAEGIYRSLPQGGFIDANPALATMLGFESPADLLLLPRHQVRSLYADPAQAAHVIGTLEREGRVDNVRSQIHRHDGSTIWISENVRAVRDDEGRVLFYEGTAVDITERLQAEERLRESEELYKTLVENSLDGVFLIQRGRVLFVNEALADMLGYGVSEMVGKEYLSIVVPEERAQQMQRRLSRESGSREPQQYEITVMRKDGERRLFAVRADAVEFDGDIASTGTMRDVTDEKRQQRALAEAEQKYRELFEQSVVGLFQTRADGVLLEANSALARLLGYDTPRAMIEQIGSTHVLYADHGDREHLVEMLDRQGEVANEEFRFRCRSGKLIWVEVSARAIRDEAGRLLYYEGSVEDVTARRLAEQALQQSEARYRTLVEHSQVGVYIMVDDRYTYVNHAFAAMVGYSEAELVGMTFRALLTDESAAMVEQRYQRQLSGRRNSGEYECSVARKDGSIAYVNISGGRVNIDGMHCTTGTVRDITEKRRFEDELRFNATHDALTGLPNRVLFEQALGARIEAGRGGEESDYAVLFLDLDGFKLVNDSLGHAAGDRLLLEIAARLSDSLGDEAMVARYGGDEFTMLPEGACPRERAQSMAERILALLAEPFEIAGHRMYSGASLGIVLGRSDYGGPGQVLRDADTAMYRAKASGKASYVIFDEGMHEAARERFQLETELRVALSRGEFRVFYQPLVNMASGEVVGCEALVRWQHPRRGLLEPAEFLAVAEEAGLIVALDWWVLEQTCRQLLDWQTRFSGCEQLRVNVNVDDRQFGEPDMVRTLAETVARIGIAPASISLEVTETVFRRGLDQAEARLHALKAIGISLVVDDFGTGYSSLDSFAAAPFDALKIDKSFVRDMESNHRHRAIVRTICAFARDLGLALTAEGVETQAQAELLIAMGCRSGQGFLYAHALPADEMEQVLAEGQQLLRRA